VTDIKPPRLAGGALVTVAALLGYQRGGHRFELSS
jgi:hypothetical protein